MEGYLRDAVYIFAFVGYYESYLDDLGKTEFCLSHQLRAYAWNNPLPPFEYILPIPIALL